MSHNKYAIRDSYFDVAERRRDENHDLGFDYRNELLKRSTSSLLFNDEKRASILKYFNDLYVYMIDNVKNIKKTFVYSVPRNSRNIN
jgi:hypothetical protein